MKRWLMLIFCAAAMMLPGAEIAKIRCATYPVWLLTSEITRGAKNLRVEVVIPPGTGCPHDYVLVPRDMERLSEPNQAVIVNGLGMDDFIVSALGKVNPGIPVIEACVPDARTVLADDGKNPNPHLFASPDTARLMVRNITAKLSFLDKTRAALYEKNARALDEKLAGLEKFAAGLRRSAPEEMPAVVIQHGIFSYLARLTGVKVILLSESDDETALTPVQLRRLVREVRKEKACMIWADSHAPQDAVKTLSRECRLPVVTLDMLSGGSEKVSAGHYERTMKHNLEILKKSLR